MTSGRDSIRFGIDVGGTFTDFALATPTGLKALKLPTTSAAPERTILTGIQQMLAENDIAPGSSESIVHGTTLATNAIISRTGARTALLTTEGFRDVLEMADEGRFDKYDVNIVKPKPLVPRWWRYTIRERLSADGDVLLELDEEGLEAVVDQLKSEAIESLAICFLHSHVNPAHEQRARNYLQSRLPDLSISLSSDVSPEIGEYERFSTTAANAYVQPLIASYVERLQNGLNQMGVTAPLFMFLSNGGLTSPAVAQRFPIRLVESGPAGGAIFAGKLAKALNMDEIVAFDMGGTTAKLCLIDDGIPRRGDHFEMAREHMHRQGSGLPARIPVVDLVEIGAGGGSIARVDSLKRLSVGPESAGGMPGPACYNRGGATATVTDANLMLGRLAPTDFDGSGISISPDKAEAAIADTVGGSLGIDALSAAAAITEVVEEQMAGAAREHAREKGIDLRRRVMIAFGGAGPVHAVSLAAKLGIGRVMIPDAAGIGSAVGFLQAPAAFEISRSVAFNLDAFDKEPLSALFNHIGREAMAAVESAAPDETVRETRTLFMRYVGQGLKVGVDVSDIDAAALEADTLRQRFHTTYAGIYKRRLEGIAIECVGISLRQSAGSKPLPDRGNAAGDTARINTSAQVFDLSAGEPVTIPVDDRDTMDIGVVLEGPRLIKDAGTTIVVPRGWHACRCPEGHLVLSAACAKELT